MSMHQEAKVCFRTCTRRPKCVSAHAPGGQSVFPRMHQEAKVSMHQEAKVSMHQEAKVCFRHNPLPHIGQALHVPGHSPSSL